ncbi:MAG: hypothetical protein ACKVTZ_14710 [Bacteroidia bacterium]
MVSFSPFKTLEEALLYFQIAERTQEIFPTIANIQPVPENLVSDLDFNITQLPYNVSEASLCEMIIFPILKEVWKRFTSKLLLWSHKSIGKDADMAGIPDYILAKRSPLGRVMDLPLLVMIEAKKDDFDAGWGQCVAQMVTAKTINQDLNEVYGIVTNGNSWEFAQLQAQTFTKHKTSYALQDLASLYNVLYHLFEICEAKVSAES